MSGVLTAIIYGEKTMSQDEGRSISVEVDAISGFLYEKEIFSVL